MALSIKNPRTEKLARQVARKHGETITEAITRALEERLAKTQTPRPADVERRRAKLYALMEESQKIPKDYSLTEDEILGYDENGLFK
jgi:antitoxin VapB